MNGRVLFINHDWYQTDVHYPLNYGYIASSLIPAGAEVEIYDMAVYHQTNKELAHFLDENTFDIIGVSFMAGRYKETVEELLNVTAHKKRDSWLVVGGPGPSPISDFFLSTTDIDVVVIGEGEETIVDLLRAKLNNENLSDLKGIAYKDNGNVITTEPRHPPKHLDKIPFPAWHLSPMNYYTTCLKFFNQEPDEKALQIITSRGCTGSCSFCFRMHKGVRLRSINNIIDEIKLLKKRYGVTYFLFADELFVISKKRLYEFKDALDKNDLQIKFMCDARVDLFDMEVATTLKETGCQFVNIGFESLSQSVLDKMHKKVTVEQNIKAAEVAKKAKLPVGLNILWGCPGDTEESLRKGVDFIKRYSDRNHSQIRNIKPVTCYPGCPLYYQAIKDGLLLGPDDFFKAFLNSDSITINFTDIGTREMYRLLYEANYELIRDYHLNAPEKLSEKEMNNLIDDFHTLYFINHNHKFRGARHYSKLNASDVDMGGNIKVKASGMPRV